MIRFENDFIRVSIETEPFFRVAEFIDKKDGRNVLTTGKQCFFADRKELGPVQFLAGKKISNLEYELSWKVAGLTLTKHLFFYKTAPAIRWYDTFTTAEDYADIYYSDLAAVRFEARTSDKPMAVDFFSCSDQSNHRLIEKDAVKGKNKGAIFIANGVLAYKEGPWPDCQPIPCEYDFIWDPEKNHLNMLGLGFDNLRVYEPRRANGVVLGLTRDFGMQRYRNERYAGFAMDSFDDVLSNSWPELELGISEEAISKELYAAAQSGVTCVFIDDGWFSTFMGEIDEKKFPNKFNKLKEIAQSLGIEIGLWMDPLGADVREPKIKLWDGAECHDTMLEKNPWNWLARDKDFHYAELIGPAGSPRSYAPLEIMDPECRNFRKDYIVSFYKNYGIRHFKFDLYKLYVFNTLLGDAQMHYEAYRTLLQDLQKEIPELIISMDVTRRSRPNFDFALDFGRLFLENRGRRIPDHRYYHPYMALGNFWYTLKYAPARQLEIEMMPQAMDYPLEYTLGTTIFGAPLYWGVIDNTPADRRAGMKKFYEEVKPLRKKFASYLNTAVGDMPLKGTWSGILSVEPAYSEGYLAVYRNGAEKDFYEFTIPFGKKLEVIRGNVKAELNGCTVKVTLSESYAFALLRFA